MAEWQGRIRTELGDLYFYWTAVFGSEGLTFWVSVGADSEECSAYLLHDFLTAVLLFRLSVERSRVS